MGESVDNIGCYISDPKKMDYPLDLEVYHLQTGSLFYFTMVTKGTMCQEGNSKL